MPRNMDLIAKAKELDDAIQRNENLRQQFVARFDAPVAALIVADCLKQSKQPGPLIEDILTDYYNKWHRGAHLELPTQLRRAIDVIAQRRGKTREECVLDLLATVTFKELEQITTESDRLEELLKKAEGGLRKK